MVAFSLVTRPVTSLAGLAAMLAGLGLYGHFARRRGAETRAKGGESG